MTLPGSIIRHSASMLTRSSVLKLVSRTSQALNKVPAAVSVPVPEQLHTCRPFCTSQQLNNLWGPKIQQRAPDFRGMAVIDGEFKEVQLSDYQGKWLVLFFYPLDFTFVCPTELIAYSDKSEEFKKIGCEVVGVSVDSHYSHFAWINMPRKAGGLGGLKYPLLSDLSKNIARAYGVLLEEAGVALRGLFIIDPKSILRQITVNDLPVGRSVDETLRLVKAFQFTDKYGEVCPANWTPDSPTIKPDPVKAQEYFGKVK